MKRLILFLILAVFGLFVYFISFKGEVYLLFIPVLAVLIAVYYVISSLVTEKMIEKKRDDENFFYLKCSKISDDETSTVPGALAVTSSEIVFYVRKDAAGNIKGLGLHTGGAVVYRHQAVPVQTKYFSQQGDGHHHADGLG